MAVKLKRKFFTAKEYLEMERSTPEKNEYFNGDIFAMAGASRRHNLIGTNVSRMLSTQLRKEVVGRLFPRRVGAVARFQSGHELLGFFTSGCWVSYVTALRAYTGREFLIGTRVHILRGGE